jgi:acyl-CoA synthetase (AMP-forming)/AMP-acid ligase II
MIVAENSTPLIAALFATSAIDACAIVANPRLSPRELDTMREHATPRRVLFATGVAAEVDEHARRIAADDVGAGLAMSALDTSAVPDDDRSLAAIVYTTGTSGRPKGVMLTHANLLFVAETSATLRDIVPADRVFGALPIYHVYGLASMLLGSFTGGARLHVVARFDAQRALGMLAHDGLTIFQGVPAMYARMLERLPDGRTRRGARPTLPLRRRLDPRSEAQGRGRETLRLPAAQRLRADRVLADRVADAPWPSARRHLGRARRSPASSCTSSRRASCGCAGRT